jgi:hypothetical protein
MADQDNFQDTPQHTSLFDATRHADEQGSEYWSAREPGRIFSTKSS